MTIIVINNVRIGNFSSPHSFIFTTGDILPACSNERAKELELTSEEIETPNPAGWTDIALTFKMSSIVRRELREILDSDCVDVCIVPLPVLVSMKADPEFAPIFNTALHPFRTCRVADRVTKTVHSDRFCL